MDLNQLLYHHQIALIRESDPQHAGCSLVDHYARRITRARRRLGAVSWKPAMPDAVLPFAGTIFG